ncbi:MAG: AraC family transcriptional regulator [Ottowia sp.]|uniref:AraC family transcriptional regulator n=1 Tax=unclassified Ottowia TaxID=2645081 RepID=UPI003C2C3129
MTLQAPATVPVAFVRGMLLGVQARGEACEPYLAEAGIQEELLGHAGARVTAAQYAQLFKILIERRADEGVGFLSRPIKPGSFALMARYGMGAPNVELAMRRVAEAFSLLQDDFTLITRQDGGQAALALVPNEACAAQPVFWHEMLLRVLWRLIAWLAGGRLPATRFDFAFAAPPHVAGYSKIFPAPLAFGCAESAVWFDAGCLRSPVQRDELALRAFLANAQTNIVLPQLGSDVVSTRVRHHLLRTQPAWPDLGATAEALCMSTATLQRKLALEGTSFQALKDALRRDIAILHLSASSMPMAALAQDLGFTDSAAFQRAFKGWTGSAPGAYRRKSGL